jgi:hypothetical protein
MSPKIAALVIAGLALFGLSACTGSPAAPESVPTAQSSDQPGDDGQSTADACALVQQSIQEATEEFERAATADPATAAEAMTAAAAQLAQTATQVTNDEVAALLPSVQDIFSEVGATLEAIVGGDVSKVGELAQLGTELREASEAFQAVCAG